jgi:hypothetical protein
MIPYMQIIRSLYNYLYSFSRITFIVGRVDGLEKDGGEEERLLHWLPH